MEFFDSHSHYNDEKFDIDRDDIIKSTYQEGISKFICAGYDIESSKKSIEISKKYDFIYSICGISPNDVPENEKEIKIYLEQIKNIIKNNISNIVAIGEIGLDYYWNKENKDIQKEMFIKQIELANNFNLPIVIHTREAVEDTLDILKNISKSNNKGIFHCCLLNRELVKEALKLDYYISFAGPITFKNSKNAQEIVNMVPLEKILIETDSPYLAPEPKRGTRNDSRNVKFIAEKIAEFKNISVEEVADKTYKNAKEIFRIK